MPHARAFAVLLLLVFAWTAGCGGTAPAVRAEQPFARSFAALDGARYVWLEASCNDGALDLSRLGFERELHVAVLSDALLLTLDTELVTDGCRATSVMRAAPAEQGELWRFEPQAVVSSPHDRDCGAQERENTLGSLRASGEVLELVLQRSPWCRGFDARFVYLRAPPSKLDERALVARYVAHWNRADAAALAALFVDRGSLVEPFTRTEDGNYKRHEGREQVRAWFERAFDSVPWHAVRLLSVTPGTTPGHLTAEWEYMDPRLSRPLAGRNLFVIAGGEIYETEVQLVADPEPAGEEPTAAPAEAPPPAS